MKVVVSSAGDSAGSNSAARVVLLGGFRMPASTQDVDGSSREERAQRALALMAEALEIIDSLGNYPELGARLHGVIEALKDEEGEC